MSQQPKALELFEADLRAGFRFGRDELWNVLREAKAQAAELESLRASLRTQRTVIDDQQAELDRKSDAIQRLWAERDQLRSEIERLRKDAERYQWLRDVGGSTWRPMASRVTEGARGIDAAIDAEREAKG